MYFTHSIGRGKKELKWGNFLITLIWCEYRDDLPWSQRFSFAAKRQDERERRGERKPLVEGDANLTMQIFYRVNLEISLQGAFTVNILFLIFLRDIYICSFWHLE